MWPSRGAARIGLDRLRVMGEPMPDYWVQSFERVSLTSISPGAVHPRRFSAKSAARKMARRLLRRSAGSASPDAGICVLDDHGAAIWWSDTPHGAGAPWIKGLDALIRRLSAP